MLLNNLQSLDFPKVLAGELSLQFPLCYILFPRVTATHKGKYYNGYILRIDCGKTQDSLVTTPNSQRLLDALAIDDPLEYARLYFNFEIQDWINSADMEWYNT